MRVTTAIHQHQPHRAQGSLWHLGLARHRWPRSTLQAVTSLFYPAPGPTSLEAGRFSVEMTF